MANQEKAGGSSLERRFRNVRELSNYLGVPVGWVYDRTQANGPEIIPHIKLGKYIRFDPRSEVFKRWLSEHEVTAQIDSNLSQGHTLPEGKRRAI
jgi:hypothetical protein